jgi:hypothetical protein
MYITDDPLHVPTRKLRATLAARLATPLAFSIGTPYTLRAIVVPIPNFNPWKHADARRAFAEAKRQFAQRLAKLKKDSDQ